MKPQHAYLTVSEVAEYYRVSDQTIWKWIKEGRLKAENISSRKRPIYRIPVDALKIRPTPPPMKIKKFV